MKNHISKLPFVVLLIDIFLLVTSCKAGCNFSNINNASYIGIIIAYLLLSIAILYLKDNYKLANPHDISLKTTYLLFEGIVLANIPLFLLIFFISDKIAILKFIGINLILSFALIWIFRILLNFYMYKIRKVKNVLILGNGKNVKDVIDIVNDKKSLGWKVVAILNDGEENAALNNYKTYSTDGDLKKILTENKISIIINTVRYPKEKLLTNIISNISNNTKLYDITEIYEKVLNKYFIDDLSIRDLFYHYLNNRSIVYDFCKRVFDIISALIILIVTLPITAYIALRVKLTDGASPFFTQPRMGHRRKIFNCYKLRTMYVNDYVPKNSTDVKYASADGDDRIIPFCKFARKARFDEIPQMINILKGEMSVVAPRAEWVNEGNIFLQEVPFYGCRMWVKIGWTGWGHINIPPCYTVNDEKNRLAHDLYYIKKRNVLWEIGILVKAVFLAISGRHK